MVASSTDYQGPMPMDIDRVQDAKGKGKKGKNDHQKGKGKDAKGKEGDQKGKGKGKDQTGKGVATCYTCDILLGTVARTIFDRLRVTQAIHLQQERQ